MPGVVVSRRQIVRACKAKGWTIQPGPLAAMERVLKQDDHLTIMDLLQKWVEPQMKSSGGKTVTDDVWQAVVDASVQAQRQDIDYSNEEDYEDFDEEMANNKRVTNKKAPPHKQQQRRQQQQHHRRQAEDEWDTEQLKVVSAFHQPKLVFNTMRQQFRMEEKVWSLFGTAEEKVDMLAQRYALIHQRILRHKMFRPTSLTHLYGKDDDDKDDRQEALQFQLTPMERLLGQRHHSSSRQGGESESSGNILVLGVLRELDDNRQYFLEDPTGLVPISLQHAKPSDPSLVLAEDNIYLVEGTWNDGTLIASRLAPPLLESRTDSLKAIHQQIQHPLLSLPSSSSSSIRNDSDQSGVVILSDVHLDQPQVVQQLEGLLASYEAQQKPRQQHEASAPLLFCLMGNFSSTPTTRTGLQSLLRDELAGTISKFPHLSQHAHFVLVPGPLDVPPSAVLPWALPFGKSTFSGIGHVTVSTNPTRLYWNGTEMVLFRSLPQQLTDLEELRLSLPSSSPSNVDASQEDMEEDKSEESASSPCAIRLIKTMLDQGHLVPGGTNGVATPIYWNYDHAMRLYPAPTCLVVGMGAESFSQSYGGCRVIAPGSLGLSHEYALYQQQDRQSLDAMLLDDDDEVESEDDVVVQILQLGPVSDQVG